jgi:hypothetical protein
MHFELHRMPELFCGFAQDPGKSPVLYTVRLRSPGVVGGFRLPSLSGRFEISGVDQ